MPPVYCSSLPYFCVKITLFPVPRRGAGGARGRGLRLTFLALPERLRLSRERSCVEAPRASCRAPPGRLGRRGASATSRPYAVLVDVRVDEVGRLMSATPPWSRTRPDRHTRLSGGEEAMVYSRRVVSVRRKLYESVLDAHVYPRWAEVVRPSVVEQLSRHMSAGPRAEPWLLVIDEDGRVCE